MSIVRCRPALRTIAALALLALTVVPAAFADETTFTTFESGQVRPLALSPDGSLLFAANTPDARLEIFSIGTGSLTRVGSVPVGLEPVAIAARGSCSGNSSVSCDVTADCTLLSLGTCNTQVWVVNHLSDSISIVDATSPAQARVVRTLLVGDEPRDVVFAGPGGNRAFVTTAHRGQNTPLQANIIADLRTEGIGRADVWVFDAANLGTSMAGTPLTRIQLFGDTPRALTVSPDGTVVYAAVFHSGNRTTTLNEGVITNNGGLPPPNTSFDGTSAPNTGLIVKFNGSQWVDEENTNWSSFVKFNLPDQDVFAIDATTNPPQQISGPSGFWPGVGTVLFNMAVNPVSGKVYVSNTEALNDVRFEGPGTFAGPIKPAGEPATVRGHLAESRITVLNGLNVQARHLNKHIDYTQCCGVRINPATGHPESNDSLGFPLGMTVSSDGSTLYVAAFGSSKIGIFNTAALENNTFVPTSDDHIAVTGGGPTAVVLDEARSQLYVMTRFDNSISIVDTVGETQVAHVGLHNPEPASVVNGRPFLYDTALTSSHGDSACASCHIFGDFDSLAWDLGNPDETVLNNPGPFRLGPIGDPDFHPMKGPMTTQSLRGMANHGPMHWRGDRTGGNDASNSQPDSGAFNEDAAFKKFNPAFPGLLGRSAQLTAAQMASFTNFILQVMYPPNPIRPLNNVLTAEEDLGRTFYFGPVSDGIFDCNGCHVLDPNGNLGFGVAKPGFFGGDGRSSFENETQHFKIAHLRNMYQKVGMFGMAAVPFFESTDDHSHTGDQVRGFGFLHDGSTDTLFRFHGATVFNVTNTERRQLEAFVLAFDTNLAPIVGQQITRTGSNGGFVDANDPSPSPGTLDGRIDLLRQRADALECDLIAKGTLSGLARGWLYVGSGQFISDRQADASVTLAALKTQTSIAGQEVTFTCVPPNNGERLAIDRDEDGFRDRDEIDQGSDPADASSVPGSSVCGNGITEAGEQCDTSGQSATCDTNCTFAQCGDGTFNSAAGEQCDTAGQSATCDANCTLAQCGDGTFNSAAGEQCDTGGQSATCDANCTLAQCGDGTFNSAAGEQCDTGGASTTCDADCTTVQCGDGTTNTPAGEQCDTSGQSATCDANCTFVACGDGTLNGAAGEECEGANLNGQSCTTLGFGSGTLACSGTCNFDTSSCTNPPVCGNGVTEAGEQCDTSGQSATCDANCTFAVCGDGTTNSAAGEQCDTSGESASCDADCTSVQCGDGNANSVAGEQCDGSDLSGETCVSRGYASGTLACTGACAFDTSGCEAPPACGDGTIDAGEECDGANLGGQTCPGLGFGGGTLACSGGCVLDTSGCTPPLRPFAGRTLKISKLTKPAGEQKIGLRSLALDGSAPPFNPRTQGLTLTITGSAGTVWQATITPDDPDWKVAGDTLKWTAKSAPHPQGLKSFSMGLPGQPFEMRAKTGNVTVSGVAGETTLDVTLTIDVLTWTGSVTCATSPSGAVLKCQ